jgi:hypothetical protein
VSNFPDPSGHGIQIGPGTGINPASPSFKAAQSACHKLLPGGGPGNQHPTAQQIATARQLSACMRSHGVSNFPDPTLAPPSSPSPQSFTLDLNGVVFKLPSTISPTSPAFAHAARACHFPLPGA